jgi:hypothetical protein
MKDIGTFGQNKTGLGDSELAESDSLEEMLEGIEDQVVEWELRWRDQAEKEEQIHEGVVTLTEKMTELTGRLGEVRCSCRGLAGLFFPLLRTRGTVTV